jgi:2-polyprenyl-3-methyl-5-hydroxy-6-metoxy-1,4-benzoquinol methylase
MSIPEMPNPGQFMEMIKAFRNSRIILTADELGLFDHIRDEGSSSSMIAELLHTHPRATDRLMNALVALGLLCKENALYTNTGFTSRFLVKSSPSYLGGLPLANQTWKTWSTLSEAVRKGTTVAMDWSINERPETWRNSFIAAMHARAERQAPEVAAVLDLTTTRKVLDVGGGSGAFSFAMIRSNPEIHATVFDLPNIIPLSLKYIENSGLSAQVDTITGDYLADNFGFGYDLVFMSAIIHINSIEENQFLIKKGTEALNNGGMLIILDHIMNDDRTEPKVGTIFALNMLVGTFHGDTYSENEITSWMKDAGLVEIELKVTSSGDQLMVGKKV